MMKKNLISIVIVICLVSASMLATLSACVEDTDSEVPCNVACVTTSCFNYMSSNTAKQITSAKQLTKFCDDAIMMDRTLNERRVYTKLMCYDKSFFKDNSLILVFKEYGNPQNLEFVNLEKQGRTLTVNIHNIRIAEPSYASPCVVEGYLFIIEVKKSSVRDIKQIEIKEKIVIKSIDD